MCASIGVDPLSSGKGFWSVLGIGDFYYELAVQIVEVCLGNQLINDELSCLNVFCKITMFQLEFTVINLFSNE